MEAFESRVTATWTKFKRLQGDWFVAKSMLDQDTQKMQLLSDSIRFEQMIQSTAISTLVELEFIQQSLDFQDEFDKHSFSLIGLNDLNITYEDLVQKDKDAKQHMERTHNANPFSKEKIKTVPRNLSLLLTDECLSCGDERMKKKITSAFKMACFHYAPSPVIFRGKKYERKGLIEAKRTMLD